MSRRRRGDSRDRRDRRRRDDSRDFGSRRPLRDGYRRERDDPRRFDDSRRGVRERPRDGYKDERRSRSPNHGSESKDDEDIDVDAALDKALAKAGSKSKDDGVYKGSQPAEVLEVLGGASEAPSAPSQAPKKERRSKWDEGAPAGFDSVQAMPAPPPGMPMQAPPPLEISAGAALGRLAAIPIEAKVNTEGKAIYNISSVPFCRTYKNGFCSRGASCRFVHDVTHGGIRVNKPQQPARTDYGPLMRNLGGGAFGRSDTLSSMGDEKRSMPLPPGPKRPMADAGPGMSPMIRNDSGFSRTPLLAGPGATQSPAIPGMNTGLGGTNSPMSGLGMSPMISSGQGVNSMIGMAPATSKAAAMSKTMMTGGLGRLPLANPMMSAMSSSYM